MNYEEAQYRRTVEIEESDGDCSNAAATVGAATVGAAAEAAEEGQGLPQYAAMWNVRSDLNQKVLHNELYEIDVEPDYIVTVEVLDGAFLLCYSTHPQQAKTMCHALDGMDHIPSNGRLRMEMLHNPSVPIGIMNAYARMEPSVAQQLLPQASATPSASVMPKALST